MKLSSICIRAATLARRLARHELEAADHGFRTRGQRALLARYRGHAGLARLRIDSRQGALDIY